MVHFRRDYEISFIIAQRNCFKVFTFYWYINVTRGKNWLRYIQRFELLYGFTWQKNHLFYIFIDFNSQVSNMKFAQISNYLLKDLSKCPWIKYELIFWWKISQKMPKRAKVLNNKVRLLSFKSAGRPKANQLVYHIFLKEKKPF